MSNNNSHVNILIGQVSSNNPKLGWIIDSSVNIFFPATELLSSTGNCRVEVSLNNSGNCAQGLQPTPVFGKDLPVIVSPAQPFLLNQRANPPGLLHIFWVLFMLTAAPFYSYVTQEDERLGGSCQSHLSTEFPLWVTMWCHSHVTSSDHTIAGLQELSAASSLSSCSLDQLLGVFCEGFLIIMDTWGKQLLRMTVWEQGASSSVELQLRTMNSW